MKSFHFVAFQLILSLAMSSLGYAGISSEMSLSEIQDETRRIKSEFERIKDSHDLKRLQEICAEMSQVFDSIQKRIVTKTRGISDELYYLRETQYFITTGLFVFSFQNLTLTLPENIGLVLKDEIAIDESLPEQSDLLRRAALSLYLQGRTTEVIEREIIYLMKTWLDHAGYFSRRNVASSLRSRIKVYLDTYLNVDQTLRQSFINLDARCEDTIRTWDAVDRFTD